MNLADRIETLRRQHERQAAPRAAAPAGRPALHSGGRFARWHVGETTEQESESWLLTYLDLITLLLAMLVVLLGVSQLPKPSQAASAPVELVGSVAQAGAPLAAWAAMAETLAAATPSSGPQGVSGMAPHALLAAFVPQPTLAPHPALGLLAAPEPSSAAASPSPRASDGEPALDTPPAQEPAAPPEPAPPSIAELGLDDLGDGVDVIVNEKSISFRISNELLFPSGQAMLSPSGLKLIQRMATVINRSEGYPVSVEGHSDPVPIQTRQFPSNWELSASRATSVLRELVRDGVAPARLRAVGYADTHPIASNDSAAGRAANRRVELIMEITPRDVAGAQHETASTQPPGGVGADAPETGALQPAAVVAPAAGSAPPADAPTPPAGRATDTAQAGRHG